MRTGKQTESSHSNAPKTRSKAGRAVGTFGRILAGTFLVLVISGCIVLSVLTVYVLNLIHAESEYDLRRLELSYTTIIYATDEKNEPYELQRLHSEENRIWVDVEEMPQHLLDAAVAGEDKRFYQHHGVDWVRTVKAFLTFMNPNASGVQGGSTITQQLIKNISGEDKVSIDRKVKEIFRAVKMTNSYTKTDVLEAYLNTIHLGNNTNGVQAAANLYFDKDVSDLTIAESAALVAITQYPVQNELFGHEENNRVRREYIIGEMLNQGMISQKEYDVAMAEDLTVATQKAEEQAKDVQSWFVDNLIEEVLDDLVEKKGYERPYAYKLLTTGGLHIYTTVDQEMQDYLEDMYAKSSTFPKVSKLTKNGKITEEQPQSAMVIMDFEGNIKAMVGGRGEKEGAMLYNRAVHPRSPGSTIKPIATYGPAIDMNLVNFSTIVPDQKININGWSPKNHYSGYLGPVTVDEAIQRSINTVAAQVMMKMGPQVSYDFLKDKLGITTLVESDIGPSPMAIGSMTEGMSVKEITAAYQIFGNGGVYHEPRSYTKILDSDGHIVLEKTSPPVQAIASDSATVMNQLLQNVVKGSHGTGARASLGGMPVAGKTGTTDNDYDQWFVGMTPYYVAGVWMGYDQPATIKYSQYPPPIVWKNVMSGIHKGLRVKSFPYDDSVVRKEFCMESGDLATPDCKKTGTGYYRKDNIPPTCTECEGGGSSSEEEEEPTVIESTLLGPEKPEPDEEDEESSSSGPGKKPKPDSGHKDPEKDDEDKGSDLNSWLEGLFGKK